MTKLTPPDTKRCQAERKHWNPWSMGGNPEAFVRCENKPVFIAKENVAGKDGKKGSMSVCRPCRRELEKQLGKTYCTFTSIKPRKPKGSK